ncbi:MAG: hypothetical protein IKT12_02860, partial [Thermoguttaceae bacterium]|nr:hypothetical protein [Thermoguttaceae bacterium]
MKRIGRRAVCLAVLLVSAALGLAFPARGADGASAGAEGFAPTRGLSEDAVIRGYDLPCSSFQIWGDYYVGKG